MHLIMEGAEIGNCSDHGRQWKGEQEPEIPSESLERVRCLLLELCLCGELRSCALFHSQKEQVVALGKRHSYPEGPLVITSM